MHRQGLIALAALAATLAVAADDSAPATDDQDEAREADILEVVTIVGSRDAGQRTPGAAQFVGGEELERFAYADVQRIARQIPGVSVQVEDGFGLRPNISIRGVATERSARITLLEDGVLIAPAPYSAPSAYYFPTAGRMAAFEVLKGPAAITQGPYTIGGAFNMISTPIPRERSARLLAETGQDATHRVHAAYGGRLDNGFGFLVEGHQWQSEGFQTIDRSGADTGLNVRDATLKLAYAPAPGHELQIKLQSAAQKSNQSYLGLADADFAADPVRRYGLSRLDRIDTDHEQAIAHYEVARSSWTLSLAAYHNGHARNWFKTEGVDLDGSANAQAFSRRSWASIVQAVNRGQAVGDWSAARLAGVLAGTEDTPAGSIQVRANDRQYFSRGVQGTFEWRATTGAAAHSLKAGVRLHEDEEDRLQRNSTYSQRGGALHLDDRGRLGNAGNRIQQAEAVALFVQDRVDFGRWTLTPGLRYEDIDQRRRRYEIRPGRTDDPSSRAAGNLRSTRANRTRMLLPGVGAIYRLDGATALVAGVHKGFTAPSNAPGVDAEEAWNFEFGVRSDLARLRVEAMAFLSDYDNLLGECTSSSGADCEAGDAFNGDAATVRGLELRLTTDIAGDASYAMPFEVAYTWMDGTFDTDIADTDFFGDVRRGDPLPYIPPHQLHAMLGVAKGRWSAHASANFVDSVCVRASCGPFEAADSSLTVDISARLRLNATVTVLGRIENLADTYDIVGRHPYGARPNRGRTASVGVELAW